MQNGLPCSLDSNHNRSHIRHICRVGLALLQTGHPLTHDSPATFSLSNHPHLLQTVCSLQNVQGLDPLFA